MRGGTEVVCYFLLPISERDCGVTLWTGCSYFKASDVTFVPSTESVKVLSSASPGAAAAEAFVSPCCAASSF